MRGCTGTSYWLFRPHREPCVSRQRNHLTSLELLRRVSVSRPLPTAAAHSLRPHRLLVRIGKILTAIALIGAIGGHWAALQGIAWTAMMAESLRTDSLAQALSNTFDGRHPCCLCKAIAAGKKTEKKSDLTPGKTKLEYPPPARDFRLFAPVNSNLFAAEIFSAESVFSKPPLPPPRNLLA